jgi:threonine dehydrogenase-like Zn-dependent dehydrogenase
MKSVRFHAAKDIRGEDVAAPTKTFGANDVLIKPLVTGICGTAATGIHLTDLSTLLFCPARDVRV